ncbi:ABC transporter ATP-binding protein [Paralcaligenes sp. KSB-10]|uniref:ABC transporter ATP-binding protein n=1 Tax=Paralcaligenes sp. KSB-10 TaxID=2901142 RepID=UPI001E4DB500|nr:ABC transporter ATP-binding protein [Paralcaligenes sp. KSB-10]UHL64694.1 ABC transporter ATP-binding protein [Paralcaligenes sp. KSB-10]
MSPMLEVRDLYASYGAGDVLQNMTLHVPERQIGCLLGANGAGKSTTMRSLSGLLRPLRGSIFFEGEPIESLSTDAIVARGIVLVPEGRRVFTPLSVHENLEMGGYKLLRARRHTEFRRNMDYVLGLFPRLAERASQAAGTLSGGEQQMVAIGRALMSSPRLLMLDEPSMGLAPLVVKDIFSSIQRLQQEGLTLLIAEQNARLTLNTANYGYVLQEGTVAYSGSAESLRNDTRVQAAYLGI